MAPRKSVSASKRQKNSEISKIISDIMHTWEKTGKIGKSRPPTRKDAQKMAIAVAYSIHNRKTTKKAEFFDAESTFKGKIIWDWQAQIEVNPDDWQDISKNLLNSATINTIERECKNYLNEYIGEIITEAVAGEELYVYTQQYGDMIIDLTFEMDYDYLGFSSETFGAENNCMHCGQPLEEVEIWEDFRCPLCSKSISDIYQGMADYEDTFGAESIELYHDQAEIFWAGKWSGSINVPGSDGNNYYANFDLILDKGAEEGNTPIMPPMDFGQPVGWRPYEERVSPLRRKNAEDSDMVKMFYISDYEDPKTGKTTRQKKGFSLISKDDFRMWVQETEVEPCVCGVSGCLSCYLDETHSWADGYGSNCTSLWFEEDFDAETFEAPMGFNEMGPRPFYGNPRKIAIDRWGNRRFIRRRKDGTYMKNVDVGRSIAMDRRRQSQTWAPPGYRDMGDGSPSLLDRFRFRQQ